MAILNAGVPEVGRCECLWTRQADDPRCKPKLKLEAEAIEGVVEDLVKQKLAGRLLDIPWWDIQPSTHKRCHSRQ